MNGTIEICGMKFHAYHGCLPSERVEGGEYLVDFRCAYDIGAAVVSDRLEDTIDYGRVYAVVARQMLEPSNLLEHVAGRIVAALQSEFPQLEHFSVKVAKLDPPVGGECALSSVTVEV